MLPVRESDKPKQQPAAPQPGAAQAAPPTGYHRHRCQFCGLVWEHANACDRSHNAVPGSHECPGCHRCNWGLGIYDGPELPRIRNGPPFCDVAAPPPAAAAGERP
jgi:hypothetical protein